MKIILIVVLICASFACGSGFGHKLKSEKLEVYYSDKKLEPLADSLGHYWTKNNLIGKRKQFLKLVETKKGIQVLVIQSPEFPTTELSFEENNLLDSLRKDLQIAVFNNKPTSIVICDNQFKPILHFKP